ncbi:Peptidase S59 nucleoporin [Macrophomina phaseolina MS6]|uniref:Peptidase S59 nucleoporin n=1 Tax=Macrophomina phaseolina (strain MS6) TaxID=1126212 RepID=K2RKH9_MACPH|nr:Peptidase S59 nucleoporin [Macrophomina phaseolina MS6]
MSGFGGFGSAFGSNNNAQQNTGGFGSGFGSTNNTGGGFGTNTSSPFGAKPAFGASTTSASGSLFGGGTATSGGTGFGAGGGFGSTNTASTGFGGGNTGGALFGQQNKPAFGTGTTGTGGLFGGGNTASTTTPAFGAGAATAFGGGVNNQSANNGTANTPFQAHVEKDGATSQNAHYQTITFQSPYQGFSLEELRLQDYAQGRRYGNANGQAGAFGASTGFGGFGSNNTSTNTAGGFGANNTSGGLFGANNNTAASSPFGSTQNNTTGGFGSNTGGGLFGANKPATGGGLFGANNTASSGQASGGLFGTAGNTGTSAFGGGATGGFGANNNTTTGGGLFGANNQQNQNKPAFGGFGSGTSTGFGGSTTGTGFGAANNTSTGGGLFGSNNNTTSAFGANNQQQQNTNSNPFGGFGQNNQNQTQTPSTGGGLFGAGFGQNNQQNNQQNKPLFGGTSAGTTGGGLFGGNNQQQPNQTGTNLFGGNNQQQGQTGGGLFGAKPAGTTNNLFGGAANNNTNTGSNLFGGLGQNQNSQQNQTGGGLFGAKPAGQTPLFGGGANNNTSTGGGLFGGSLGQNNNAGSTGLGGGLFGASQQQSQQQQPALGGSLFGASTAQQNTNQTPQLTASMNANPYGNEHLFASLNTPSQSVGPLATPLSSSQKQKKNAILPQHRINPAASSRLITPQKRLNGYGFSYSTYGTPGSAMSGGSPSFSGSLMSGGGSFSKSLSKSFSTSSLKNTWNAEDSILSPGAFNPSKRPAYANTGSMKKLNINRALNVRPSLFGDDNNSNPASQKKRVSFDASTTLNGALDSANGALVTTEREPTTPSAEEQGFLRTSKNSETPTNGAAVNGDKTPEMSQPKGNELTIVPEERVSEADRVLRISNEKARKAEKDQTPGKYWSEPSIDELKKMSMQELKSLANFRVGREGIGEIQFEQPVDLTAVDLDKLLGSVIQLNVRNATVYPSKASTPPVGKGMNVTSLITLENSWPRAPASKSDKTGTRFQRHVERLKKVEGTDFVSYDPNTGRWQFRVYHYTTYGLDYDDDDDESMLTDPPADLQSPTPMARHAPAPLSALSRVPQEDSTLLSPAESSPDDTFDFKRGMIKRNNVPGSFDDEDAYVGDYMEDGQDDTINSTQSFLDERSVGPYEDGSDMDEAASYRSGSDSEPEHTMAGSFPIPDLTTEQTPARNSVFGASGMPKSILKASRAGFGTPTKGAFDFEGDWAAQLQRTISPKKQDRQTLRENQNSALRQFDEKNDETPKAPAFNKSTNKPFSNSIDLMNSLFGQSTARRIAATNGSPVRKGKGLEWPYQKRPKTGDELDDPNEADKAFHEAFKPAWALDGTFTYTTAGHAPRLQDDFISNLKNSIVSQHKDVRFAKFSTPEDVWPTTIVEQASPNNTNLIDGSDDEPPRAETLEMRFADLAHAVSIDTPAGRFEQEIWKLASILFDSLSEQDIPEGVPNDIETYENQIRAMKLSDFWKSIVMADADRQARLAKSAEEKAIARLSSHSITEACDALIEGKDFRLATLVAQIGGAPSSREAIAAQLEEWRTQHVLSEMSDSVRALYTILSGEFSVSDGAPGPAVENRAEDVHISSRFGLDWRQAFGLRLWYGVDPDTAEEGLIDFAVQRFEDELRTGDETVKPIPWFVRAGIKMGWDDPRPFERQDVLWGLLKLYKAYRKDDVTFSVADMLAPENTTGNPVNARLSWQLLTLLRAKNILPREVVTSDMDYDGPRPGEHFNAREITEISDALTQTFSLPLLTPEHWTHATWVLIHHTDDAVRAAAIKDLLAFNAGLIGEDAASDATFAHLTTALRIAPSWVYAAKAQHARAVLGDPVREVQYLLSAHNFAAAHEVVCRAVAPAAVVANTAADLDMLATLLAGFAGAPEKDVIEWASGGAVYADYLALLRSHHGLSHPNTGASSNNNNNDAASTSPARPGTAGSGVIAVSTRPAADDVNESAILQRLASALAALAPQLRTREVVERAALKEIARSVIEGFKHRQQRAATADADENMEGSGSLEKQRRNLLKMSITEEASLWLGRGVGVEYWRAVVVGGGGGR